jgi:hypothetical protein
VLIPGFKHCGRRRQGSDWSDLIYISTTGAELRPLSFKAQYGNSSKSIVRKFEEKWIVAKCSKNVIFFF